MVGRAWERAGRGLQDGVRGLEEGYKGLKERFGRACQRARGGSIKAGTVWETFGRRLERVGRGQQGEQQCWKRVEEGWKRRWG